MAVQKALVDLLRTSNSEVAHDSDWPAVPAFVRESNGAIIPKISF